MIYLFTDFGYNGPYVGQMKSVLATSAPNAQVIDLMHDAPVFNPHASGILLSALTDYLPRECITVAVIDPGVGDPARRPLMLKVDNRWFVGPDNGLFQYTITRATTVTCYELHVTHKVSKTFHGRDVFAPAAAELANGVIPESRQIDASSLVVTEDKKNVCEVVYIDHFGNAMTSLRGKEIHHENIIIIDDKTIGHAETFSNVSKGDMFWYVNSIGLVEISANAINVAKGHQLFIGKSIGIS